MIDELRKRFEAYREDMLRDLAALVAINSERGETKPGCPFGEGPAEALHTMLKLGEDYGFKTDNVDNYAGVIEYGSEKESVGILAHLDIVPAGPGWETDPFTMTIKDGVMYGRGVCDDKGAAVAALYGMRVLRDMNLPLKRSVKLVVGTNEEQGSACMKYYREHREKPTLGFTPDGGYPLTYAEKGCVWQWLHFPEEQTPILSFKGGNAFNAVNSKSTVLIDGSAVTADALRACVTEATACGLPVEIKTLADGNIEMTVTGKSAHGSTPQLGINAAVSAAMILRKALGEKAGKAVKFLCDVIGRDPYGKTAGIFFEDAESGRTSLNIGIVDIEGSKAKISMDVRFPVSGNPQRVIDGCAGFVSEYGITTEIVQQAEPHYVPKDSELVTKLMEAYREVTGDQDAQPETTGGGTYAKPMGGAFVAFGMEFPNRPDYKIHDVGENFNIEDWITHCVICTYAIWKLAA